MQSDPAIILTNVLYSYSQPEEFNATNYFVQQDPQSNPNQNESQTDTNSANVQVTDTNKNPNNCKGSLASMTKTSKNDILLKCKEELASFVKDSQLLSSFYSDEDRKFALEYAARNIYPTKAELSAPFPLNHSSLDRKREEDNCGDDFSDDDIDEEFKQFMEESHQDESE